MNDMTRGTELAPLVSDDEIVDVLLNSIYPGAKRESAMLALSYCRAGGYDVMLKPVHIVPMSVKSGEKNSYGNDVYVMRDTIMPGIGLYRINAARTGQYAGMDEPVIGPMREFEFEQMKREWVAQPNSDKKKPKDTFTAATITYPEYVTVTVYRLVGGFRVPFPAREYWMENYATASKDSVAPNSMWARRTIGQLIKCAEAQALRKAFPEVGSQPTAEEMSGREFDIVDAEPATTVEAKKPKRASEGAAEGGNVSSPPPPAAPALTDETAAQSQAAAMVGAALTPEQNKTLAAVDRVPEAEAARTAPKEAPPEKAAPAPSPAAEPAPPPAEPASAGEKANVLVTAKAKKVDLSKVLADLGFALNAETLDGLTKPQFKAIKGKL